jgi:eukaryotic-like serine/threonine-protein kinase
VNDTVLALEGALVLGRYRIVKPLARGGMGMVYLGRVEGAAGFAKPVVIKRILSESEKAQELAHASFIREARILSELQHPGIVGVLDFGLERSTYLMVLEYVHGYHLGHWLKFVRAARGEMAWEFAVYVLLRVLEALQYAHRHASSDGQLREVIHRDISPGNILIDFGGNVRLVDFGIARSSGTSSEFHTQDGVVKGKLPYIAPEIFHFREPSILSDVYAAGVVLYQLLAGKNPFSDRDMGKVVRRVLDDIPPPISTLRSDVPPAIDHVIARAIAKDPNARFQSAAEFSGALSALLTRPEAEVVDQFRSVIAEDFSGQLAQVLQIESLSSLDAAWRASSPYPTRQPSLRSSIPPPPDDRTLDAAVHPGVSAPPTSLRPTNTAGDKATSRRLLLMVSLALVAAVGALLIVVLERRTPATRESRFLVVERPGTSAPAAVAEPPPQAPASPTASDSPARLEASAPSTRNAPAAAPSAKISSSRTDPGADALTTAFSKRQGAVQACFSQNAAAVEGSPQISIRFQLAPSGAVQSAALSPAALSGTGLGECLLEVARSTRFPAQDQPVAFSIPITARIVSSR